MVINLEALTFQRESRTIIGPLDAEFRPGELVGVVGPNGSGKSTLLRLIYGYLRPTAGRVLLDQQPLDEIEPRQLAQKMGACPQEAEPSLDFSVEQALALAAGGNLKLTAERAARFPFLRLQDLSGRLLSQLSGGEKQRVRLGRALLPEPPWLVLDEPANHLDLATGWSLLSHLREPRHGGVIVALHDLAFAARFCHRLMVLDRGQLVSFAAPEEALSEKVLREVFSLEGAVHQRAGHAVLDLEGVTE